MSFSLKKLGYADLFLSYRVIGLDQVAVDTEKTAKIGLANVIYLKMECMLRLRGGPHTCQTKNIIGFPKYNYVDGIK